MMWGSTRALVACSMCAGAAHGALPPLPPHRPPELRSPVAPLPPPAEERAESDSVDEAREACLQKLTDLGVRYVPLAPQEDGACKLTSPIRLLGLAANRDAQRPITFPQMPLIDCPLAERLADWLRDAVSPLFRARLGSSLKAVATGVGYECRTRNRDPGAKLSAHGLGLALDISAFELSDRERLRIGLTQDPAAEDALDVVRRSACGWFTTVLGPGSPDALHESHLHLDLQQHGSGAGYRICQ